MTAYHLTVYYVTQLALIQTFFTHVHIFCMHEGFFLLALKSQTEAFSLRRLESTISSTVSLTQTAGMHVEKYIYVLYKLTQCSQESTGQNLAMTVKQELQRTY